MIDLYLASIIAFFGILGIIIYLDRKNIEFKYILFTRRTKKGLEYLDKIGKYRRFWHIIGIIAILVSIVMVADGLYSLSAFSWKIINGEVKQGGGGIIFFSPTSEAVVGTGYILIPFWFWIIIIPTLLFPHEIAHGIMSRAEKIKVKSAGLLLLLVIPGAFVEPDERGLKKAKLLSKLKIFAAGSFANIVLAFLLLNPLGTGLIPNVIWPALVPGQTQMQVLLVNVTQGSPADIAGLKNGTIITEINRMPIEISYIDYTSGQYLTKYLQNVKTGDNVEITANGTKYFVTVGEITDNANHTKPYFGISTELKTNGNSFLFNTLIGSSGNPGLLYWMWLASYAVAIFNILPIYPLDGGLMLEAISEKISKKHSREIVGVITFLTILLVIFCIFGPEIIKLLGSF